jgi:hypothetical protein
MVIEVVPAQLYACAGVLEAAADSVARVAPAVTGASVDGPLGPAIAAFTETAGTAGRCLTGELGWLGRSVAAAADSWLGFDATVLARPGRAVPE